MQNSLCLVNSLNQTYADISTVKDLSYITYVLIGAVAVAAGLAVTIYNKIVKYSNASEANLGQIRVAMKKRLDMIEQLLGAVKGYVKHEKDIFVNIAKLRAGITDASPDSLNDIDKRSRGIVTNLVAVAEAYPDLKASENVSKLMDSIVDVEDEIARHRYTYNNIVQQYNTMLQTIPSNIIAGAMNAEKIGYLEFEEGIETPPDIQVNPDA